MREVASVAFESSPTPVPGKAGGERPQQARIGELRALIEAIVTRDLGHHPASHPAAGSGWTASTCSFSASAGARWGFGIAALDAALPGKGLDPCGLHELKPLSYGDGPAAVALLGVLLARRRPSPVRPILWVAGPRGPLGTGRPYGPGLAGLGLDPASLLLLEARRAADALCAMEEGLRSGALAGVAGLVAEMSETAARRLSLAAQATATPCLILSAHASPGLLAARTRWRIAARPSAPHPLDSGAPGETCWQIELERARDGPGGGAWIVEWSDAAHAFRLASRLADRPAPPRLAGRRAG